MYVCLYVELFYVCVPILGFKNYYYLNSMLKLQFFKARIGRWVSSINDHAAAEGEALFPRTWVLYGLCKSESLSESSARYI